ncbi:MAG: HAD superfamily hydrolase (TIGR01509 family) [Psychromonas sp.]|jgi:HAD superfamily hydrolase (TIGR01509 family)|uniref:HAD-IA family hydrolase n=1 Tax=Psychromonas sp. TaxID=1884585 RepID=UPI0039E367C7
MIKCIIFDCDGTLVDSEYLCNLGLEIKLKEYAVTQSAEQLMILYKGMKLAYVLDCLQEAHQISFKDDFIPTYRAIVENLFEQSLTPCEGVFDLLSRIKLPVCVASNGPKDKMLKALQLTHLSSFFKNNLYSAYDINSWKPDPGLFLYAAKKMGFKPEQCLVIEDTLVGIEAAKAGGIRAVLYDPHELHKETLHKNTSEQLTIKHMKELEVLLLAD